MGVPLIPRVEAHEQWTARSGESSEAPRLARDLKGKKFFSGTGWRRGLGARPTRRSASHRSAAFAEAAVDSRWTVRARLIRRACIEAPVPVASMHSPDRVIFTARGDTRSLNTQCGQRPVGADWASSQHQSGRFVAPLRRDAGLHAFRSRTVRRAKS